MRVKLYGWTIKAHRAHPPRWWMPKLRSVKTAWKRGWGEPNLIYKGADLNWLTWYVTWRKPR